MLNEGNPTNRATRALEPTPTNDAARDDDTTGVNTKESNERDNVALAPNHRPSAPR